MKFLAELFAFAVILFVIFRYVAPPMRAAMRRRQETIGAQFAEAREAKEQAEAAEARYQASIRDAQAEADHLRQSAVSQAEQILVELRARAEEESERIAERGRQQLAAERDSVVRHLRVEMGTLAAELATQIVLESLNDGARRDATVERFIADLEVGVVRRGGRGESAPALSTQSTTTPAAGGQPGDPSGDQSGDEPGGSRPGARVMESG
jgi:F-type H+-transporting ATPase subunit b